MSRHSTFLFATPSWAEGVARLIDFGGTFDEYNANETPAEADCHAIYHDWMAVGEDLAHVISVHEPNRS